MARKNQAPDFEAALKELEGIVTRMEAGDVNLEESLKLFERGVELTRTCQQALQTAEQKVQVLLDRQGGQELVDFEAGADTDQA